MRLIVRIGVFRGAFRRIDVSKDIHILHDFTVGTAVPHTVLPEVESWKFLTSRTPESEQLFKALRNMAWAKGRAVKNGFRTITPDRKIGIEFNTTTREVMVALHDGNHGGMLGQIVLNETGIIDRYGKDARYTKIPRDPDSLQHNRPKTMPWTEHPAIEKALADVIKDPVKAAKRAWQAHEFKTLKGQVAGTSVKESTAQQESGIPTPKKASKCLRNFFGLNKPQR